MTQHGHRLLGQRLQTFLFCQNRCPEGQGGQASAHDWPHEKPAVSTQCTRLKILTTLLATQQATGHTAHSNQNASIKQDCTPGKTNRSNSGAGCCQEPAAAAAEKQGKSSVVGRRGQSLIQLMVPRTGWLCFEPALLAWSQKAPAYGRAAGRQPPGSDGAAIGRPEVGGARGDTS